MELFAGLNAILSIAFISMLTIPSNQTIVSPQFKYICDGNYTDKLWQIEITSCSQEFIDMAKSHLNQSDSGKVMKIKYIQSESWETNCNGLFTPFGNTLTVYTCDKESDYIIGVGDLTHDQSIEFTFLHELGHAYIRQNNKEFESDKFAIQHMNTTNMNITNPEMLN